MKIFALLALLAVSTALTACATPFDEARINSAMATPY
jgi:hypothetical protein